MYHILRPIPLAKHFTLCLTFSFSVCLCCSREMYLLEVWDLRLLIIIRDFPVFFTESIRDVIVRQLLSSHIMIQDEYPIPT